MGEMSSLSEFMAYQKMNMIKAGTARRARLHSRHGRRKREDVVLMSAKLRNLGQNVSSVSGSGYVVRAL